VRNKVNTKLVLERSETKSQSDRTAVVLPFVESAAFAPVGNGIADRNDRRRNPGGDNTTAQAENVTKVQRAIDWHIQTGTPFPANPRRPGKVSMRLFAMHADVKVEVVARKRSACRQMVEAAAKKFGIGVLVRTDRSAPRLRDLMETGVAKRRAELEAQGYPAEHHVKLLRETAHLIAKALTNGMETEADKALQGARLALSSGRLRLNAKQKSVLDKLTGYFEGLGGSHGVPEGFAPALAFVASEMNLNFTALAHRVGMNPQTLCDWGAGRNCPDPCSVHFVKQIEVLANRPGVLVSRIKRKRAGRGLIPESAYPTELQGRNNARLRGEISSLLPDGISIMEDKERHRLIRDAHEEVMLDKCDRDRRGALLKMTYGLKKFPTKLDADFTALARHKEAPSPTPGTVQGNRWKPGTTQFYRDQTSYLFGFLVSDAAGTWRIAPNRLDFTVFCDPAKLQAYHVYKLQRAGMAQAEEDASSSKVNPPAEQDLTLTDADLMTFAGSLFATDGWMRQVDDFAKRTRLSRDAWERRCDELEARYKKLAKDLRKNAKPGKNQFKASLPILEMKNPLDAISMLIRGLQGEVDGLQGTSDYPVYLQDLVWTQIQAQAALRPGTWKSVTWKSNNLGHLRRDEQGWFLEIPKQFFKNEFGKALENDFYRRIKDYNGLYRNLERFLESSRFILADGMKTDLLFLYGRKNLNPDGSNRRVPGKYKTRFYESGLAVRVRAFTKRHLAWNKRRGSGIKGIRALSPTCFRHILATAVLKETMGNYSLAADAIADSVQTAIKHYARFKPSDRLQKLEEAIDAINHSRETTNVRQD
jgi:hypothetical protein